MSISIINVREQPTYKDRAIAYFQSAWSGVPKMIYDDCITRSLDTESPLPIWYLLMDGETIIGCVGLIANDFISWMDAWPWLCALYIDEAHRGQNLGALLIEQLKQDTAAAGFHHLYLCTDHVGYYEKHGFSYAGEGYHPWGESSRVYACRVV